MYGALGKDSPYNGITQNSTQEEKFNAIFELLKKNDSWRCLDHQKLFITPEKISVFEAKLISTGLVDFQKEGFYYSFKLSIKGLIELENISFLEYIGHKADKKIELITPFLKDQVLAFLCENCQVERMSSGKTSELLQELEIEFNTLNGILSQFDRFGFISDLNLRVSYFSLVLHTEAHDYKQKGGFQTQEEIFKANLEKLAWEIENLKKEVAPKHLDTLSKIATIASTLISGLTLYKK